MISATNSQGPLPTADIAVDAYLFQRTFKSGPVSMFFYLKEKASPLLIARLDSLDFRSR